MTGQHHNPGVFYWVRRIKKPRFRPDPRLIADPKGFCLHFERKVDDRECAICTLGAKISVRMSSGEAAGVTVAGIGVERC